MKKNNDAKDHITSTSNTNTTAKKSVAFEKSTLNPQIKVVSPTVDTALTISFFASMLGCVYSVHSIGGKDDLFMFSGLTVMVAMAVQINKVVFENIAVWISSTLLSGPPFNNPMNKSKPLKKWNDQSWQLSIHVTMTLLELYVLMDEQWFINTSTLWTDGNCPGINVKFSLKFLYLTQLAIWSWTAFSHRFIEERRSDYVVMFIHHIATIILVSGSWSSRQPYIGAAILYVHDISDIPVDVMKMVNYLKLEDKAGWFLSEIGYLTVLIYWVYYRLYLFPVKLLYSATFESHLYCNPGKPYAGHVLQKLIPEYPGGYSFCVPLLVLLQILHIYWFFLIFRVGFRLVMGTSAHEIGASEYEGGSESEKEHHE